MSNGRDDKGRFLEGEWKGGPGRPKKGESLTDALREAVDKHELAAILVGLARGGDVAALKYVYDRIDGKPVETINQTVRNVPEYVGFVDSDDSEDQDADQE